MRDTSQPLVRVGGTTYRGAVDCDTCAFLGLPFAQPPVGPLRHKPPQPLAPLAGEVDCTAYGVKPIQSANPDQPTARYGEDCLHLNIWTPAIDGERRPVIFYLYGGGHVGGSNHELGMTGPALLRGREAVVVSPNYRVGALGYLYLAGLGTGYAASGSLGTLDHIAALRWVRDNIEHFGGDPDHVVLMGQSAGGKCVSSLLVAPAGRGLFHGAVIMSGGLQSIKDEDTARKLTANFVHAAGLSTAEEVLSLSTDEIVRAQEVADQVYTNIESYGPVADGVVFPRTVEVAVRGGEIAHVPVLMGHTSQENFLGPQDDTTDIGDEAVLTRLRWKFGLQAERVYADYLHKKACYGSFAEAWGRIAGKYTYEQPFLRTASLLLEAGLPLWLYLWDFAGATTAGHSAELEAIFGRTDPARRSGHETVSDALERAANDAFVHFAMHLMPDSPRLPTWPRVTGPLAPRMVFGEETLVENINLAGFDHAYSLQVMRL